MYLFVISQNVALYCAYPVDLEKRKEGKNTLKLKNEANLQSVAIQYYSNHTITIHKTSLVRKKNSQSVYKSTVHFKKFCCAGLNKQITK